MNFIQNFYFAKIWFIKVNRITIRGMIIPDLLTDFKILLNYLITFFNVFQNPENQQNGATSTRIQGFAELKINYNQVFVFCYFVFYY